MIEKNKYFFKKLKVNIVRSFLSSIYDETTQQQIEQHSTPNLSKAIVKHEIKSKKESVP